MSICRLPDFSNLPDCIALSETGKCSRLTVYKCQGEECSFKRTQKEESDSLQYAYQRLANLDSSTQSRIAQKYYDSCMPWKEEQPVQTIEDIDAWKISKIKYKINIYHEMLF